MNPRPKGDNWRTMTAYLDENLSAADAGTAHLLVGDDAVRLVLVGDIGAEVSGELTETMDEAIASGLPVEIDAHHVTFMDSAGVALIAKLAAQLPAPPKMLRTPDTVEFLLNVTGLNEAVEIVS